MSATPSDRSGRFGRRSGPDAPKPLPFVKTLLPGVTAVRACEMIGQCVARLKKADDPTTFAAIRQESDSDRHVAILAYVAAIASGKKTAPTGERVIVTGKTGIGYTAQQTADALMRGIAFLKRENPAQLDRYCDRIPGECDRALAQGRAGENPLGWSDAQGNALALKRASEERIEAARAAKAARSGVNAPAAKYVTRTRSAAQQERDAQEAKRAERARTRAAKESAGTAAQEPATGGDAPKAPRSPRRPNRSQKG